MDTSSADVQILPSVISGRLCYFSHKTLDNWDSPASVDLSLEKRLEKFSVPCKFVEGKLTIF